ncbi:aldo/keto reductase [Microbacterium radiodurans]|uniref:Aldo/keto reductase n=1 Tax=Microbacterium radiodurans TaxID=661398 RepID=A0A5J5IYC2_9MICO|nr:aldo/keto reductase [Microbacterium radiodurans]KAA9089560.1 aldo/keto reductase [Microbacterium radiodurans]
MRQRSLGDTGIPVDAITLGTSSLGRGTVPGSREEADAVDTARAFLTGPFAVVDTSNEYAGGRSEAVLGLARADIGADASARNVRNRIFTKVDRDPDTGRFDRDRVMRSFEESCARLGVDRVDVLHLHDPYSVTFAEATGPGGAVEGLRELRESGAAAAIGIAAGPVPLMTAYVETGLFDVLLSHNRFTIVDRSAEPLFELARGRGMGVFNAAPFGAGILATGARPDASYGYRPAGTDLIAWVAQVERICADAGIPLQAAALHFSLRSPLVDSTVVGVSSPRRLDQLVELQGSAVPDDVWARIDDLGPAPTTIEDDGEVA